MSNSAESDAFRCTRLALMNNGASSIPTEIEDNWWRGRPADRVDKCPTLARKQRRPEINGVQLIRLRSAFRNAVFESTQVATTRRANPPEVPGSRFD
ncbi:hypothetical protein ACRE_063320 [Hapsidospora chrysogenum ATCC 11550]|uniref:Uncharacterized protein n=1 Tax=Hapsidospora chrysogenum (strain ATCC 11550 / CBS 779.69 / DSM 880 / IAM 14645 / JCM 23072 / IMI 49137) TaxID=857340 RepID=A0A086T0S9_HAPC1|nr:hypothetical protein ACRE_063320 [Hapsidospora chrysogenum ATCC 11550]